MERKWYKIDLREKKLGRVATKAADLLRGKNKTDFAPNKDGGDYVVVINAAEIDVSPKKAINKIYYRHTGYIGHLRSKNLQTRLKQNPAEVAKDAISGMLPRNKLKRFWVKRLRVYAGGAPKIDKKLEEVDLD